jgi:putative N-acetylmannosamine-6-phosphate epimerase
MNRVSSIAILAQPLKDNPMNTTELVDAVAEANDISKAKAREPVKR